MHCLRVVVSYFPHLKTYYAKIVKNEQRANYWQEEWQGRGGQTATDFIYYKDDRETAYKALREKLVREIKNKYGTD